jgi:hypothetical protein
MGLRPKTTLELMERLAARMVKWGIGCSGAALVGAVAALLWLERSAQADGPGVGIGLLVALGVALVSLFIPVLIGTLMLVVQQQRSAGGAVASSSPAFVAGAAYCLVALAAAAFIALQ